MLNAELVSAVALGGAALLTALGGFGLALANIRKLMIEVRQLGAVAHATNQKVAHETSPNHGSSLRDAIDRIETGQRGIRRDVARLADHDNIHEEWANAEVARVHGRIDWIKDQLTAIQHAGETHGC